MTNQHLAKFLNKRGIKVSTKKYKGGEEPATTSMAESIGSSLNNADKSLMNTAKNVARKAKNATVMAAAATGASVVAPVALATGLAGIVPYGIYKGYKTLNKTSPENILAKKIVNSIKLALNEIARANTAVEVNIDKTNKLIIPNQIDMNYGGGLLVFDGNFHIKELIYMCNLQEDGEKKQMYGYLPIGDNMLNNCINSLLKEMKPFDEIEITEHIEESIGIGQDIN